MSSNSKLRVKALFSISRAKSFFLVFRADLYTWLEIHKHNIFIIYVHSRQNLLLVLPHSNSMFLCLASEAREERIKWSFVGILFYFSRIGAKYVVRVRLQGIVGLFKAYLRFVYLFAFCILQSFLDYESFGLTFLGKILRARIRIIE